MKQNAKTPSVETTSQRPVMKPVVTKFGLHVKTGKQAGLGWGGIFFGGWRYA